VEYNMIIENRRFFPYRLFTFLFGWWCSCGIMIWCLF